MDDELRALECTVGRNPGDVEAQFRLAQAYLRTGNSKAQGQLMNSMTAYETSVLGAFKEKVIELANMLEPFPTTQFYTEHVDPDPARERHGELPYRTAHLTREQESKIASKPGILIARPGSRGSYIDTVNELNRTRSIYPVRQHGDCYLTPDGLFVYQLVEITSDSYFHHNHYPVQDTKEEHPLLYLIAWPEIVRTIFKERSRSGIKDIRGAMRGDKSVELITKGLSP